MTERLSGAPVSAIAAREYSVVETTVRESEALYREGVRVSGYWAIVDLRGSARYRLLAGDERAYVRYEVFIACVRRLFSHYSEVTAFKELGDALLVRSDGIRPLVEVACVYDLVARLWGSDRGSSLDVGLDVRTTVSFGPATELHRRSDDPATPPQRDYVGVPLDRLARVAAAADADGAVIVLDDAAYSHDPGVLQEYPFLTAHGPHVVDAASVKAGESPSRYWRILADRAAMRDFRDYFGRLR